MSDMKARLDDLETTVQDLGYRVGQLENNEDLSSDVNNLKDNLEDHARDFVRVVAKQQKIDEELHAAIAQHEKELTSVVDTLELAVKTIELQGERIQQLADRLKSLAEAT